MGIVRIGVGGDEIRYLAFLVLGVFTGAGAWTFTACLDGLIDFDENLSVLLDTLARAALGCPGPLRIYSLPTGGADLVSRYDSKTARILASCFSSRRSCTSFF